jgi:hypothetical protein
MRTTVDWGRRLSPLFRGEARIWGMRIIFLIGDWIGELLELQHLKNNWFFLIEG